MKCNLECRMSSRLGGTNRQARSIYIYDHYYIILRKQKRVSLSANELFCSF